MNRINNFKKMHHNMQFILLLAFVRNGLTTRGCSFVSRYCTLPPYPEHGSYIVDRDTTKRPGDVVAIATFTYTCDTGYSLIGVRFNACTRGCLVEDPPTCERLCHLDAHPSVKYLCEKENKTVMCKDTIHEGTVVTPECGTPNYYTSQALPPMTCTDGQWNYVATCLPECGRVDSTIEGNMRTRSTEGQKRAVAEGEVPWHVGVYSKRLTPYRLVCSGSIVAPSIVISAARCFWSGETVLPSERFAVAAGKLHQEWYVPSETHVQISDVSDLKIPSTFKATDDNLENDIALVFLSSHFTYNTYVRPICLDFDVELEKKQLSHGSMGPISGWFSPAEKGKQSQPLKTVTLSFLDIEECYAGPLEEVHMFRNLNKICAGKMNDTTVLCKIDNGGGLAFAEMDGGKLRYYLRGVTSTVEEPGRNCDSHNVTTFTSVLSQEHFIKEHLTEIEKFKCAHGGDILKKYICDGIAHCSDSSDETAATCSQISCPPHLFRCEYGACTKAKICNGIIECPDGSDENDELCDDDKYALTNTTQRTCTLPQYPAHGVYQVLNDPDAKPGYSLGSFDLNYSCELGYALSGHSNIYCLKGFMPQEPPKCVPMCRLPEDPSVEYSCQVSSTNGGTRRCEEYEPDGTIAMPNCRPNYFPFEVLTNVRCHAGRWNHVHKCSADCGRVTPYAQELVSGGRIAERGELPWHVGIYKKEQVIYKQICGGTIIDSSTIITAAHCFWKDTETVQQAEYAVAAGKLHKGWNDPNDDAAQKSDVTNIILPDRFRGPKTRYQEDIALMFLSTPFTYDVHIRPVCLDFDGVLDARQLAVGNLGKVAGWGLVDKDGTQTDKLKVVDLPYIDINECFEGVPVDFQEHITADKICAGYTNGTALCRGDSGGGLVFPSTDRGVVRYYLRGVVSTAAPEDNKSCNTMAITTFTHIQRQQMFIQKYYVRS